MFKNILNNLIYKEENDDKEVKINFIKIENIVKIIKEYNIIVHNINNNRYNYSDSELINFKELKIKNFYNKNYFDLLLIYFKKINSYNHIKLNKKQFKSDIILIERDITMDEMKLKKIQIDSINNNKIEIGNNKNLIKKFYDMSIILIDKIIYLKSKNKIIQNRIKTDKKIHENFNLRFNLKSAIKILIKMRKKYYPMLLLTKKVFTINKFYDIYKAIIYSIIYLKKDIKNNLNLKIIKNIFNRLLERIYYIKRSCQQIIYLQLNNYKENNKNYKEKELKIIIYNLFKIEILINDIFKNRFYSFLEKDQKILFYLVEDIKKQKSGFINKDCDDLIQNITFEIQNKYDSKFNK